MIKERISLTHERVDDIPLLLGLLQELHFPDLLEQHLGSHHLHRGLSNGWLMTVWIAFLLSQANHRKVSVQDWAGNHQHTLETLLGQTLRPIEFSDDRLSILLRRLNDADWHALEAALWDASCEVYELPCSTVRLDSTTSFGYHDITPDGLLQRGHSKDHRPDLPQLKLMAAVGQPTSHLVACDIHPGNAADDPLYLPLIRRVRQQLGRRGLLYCGDCKMAALATRAEIVDEQDFYLMPLPKLPETASQLVVWVDETLQGKQKLQKITRRDEKGRLETLAWAYERERAQESQVGEKSVSWTERVQVVRSLELAERQSRHLEDRLREAESALRGLTPDVSRGHKQYREEGPLQAAVAAILKTHRVEGLLTVKWQREEQSRERYRGRGRGSASREKQVEVKVRYVIQEVKRQQDRIEREKQHQGWRVQVTNLPLKRYGLRESVMLYNEGWGVERDFHILKAAPLGIQPLYVREEEQIIGLTRLLMIALRVVTLSELLVRGELEKEDEELKGLYEGQPNRATGQPTTTRLLKAITRMEITATKIERGEESHWQVTELPSLLERILELLSLSPTLYTRLATNAA
jgi:transposase